MADRQDWPDGILTNHRSFTSSPGGTNWAWPMIVLMSHRPQVLQFVGQPLGSDGVLHSVRSIQEPHAMDTLAHTGDWTNVVRVQLHKTKVVAGEKLMGVVHITMPLDVVCEHALTVELECIEKVSWEESEETYCRKQTLLQQQLLTVMMPRPYPAGDYVYGFEYPLPPDLVPSVYIRNFNGNGARLSNLCASITYKIQALLPVWRPNSTPASPFRSRSGPGSSFKGGSRPLSPLHATSSLQRETLQAHAEVQVLTLPFVSINPIEKLLIRPLRKFGFSHQGECELGLRLSQTVFSSDQDVELEVYMHNRSTFMCMQVMLRLLKVVSITKQEQPLIMSRIIVERSIPQRIRPGQSLQRQVLLPMNNERDRKPMGCSVQARRFAREYVIEMQCNFPTFKDITLQVPITVVSQEAMTMASAVGNQIAWYDIALMQSSPTKSIATSIEEIE